MESVEAFTNESHLEHNRSISDAEIEAIKATFTEMASAAGRVAGSLAKINALTEEIHVELDATRQALNLSRHADGDSPSHW